MYAVIAVSGHQHKVTSGQTITVDHLGGEVGAKMEFPAILLVNDSSVLVGPEAKKTMVTATVMGTAKGEKIHIRRFRAKSKFRRHIGFRHSHTLLKIESIGADEPKKAPVAPAKPKKATRAKTEKVVS